MGTAAGLLRLFLFSAKPDGKLPVFERGLAAEVAGIDDAADILDGEFEKHVLGGVPVGQPDQLKRRADWRMGMRFYWSVCAY